MRAVRLSSCLIALILAFAVSGCGFVSTTPHAALSNTIRATAAMTPTASLKQPLSVVGNPTRLIIPVIGINAFVESLGMQPNGDMATPTQHAWEDAGWYNLGARPGQQGSDVF